MRKKNYIYFMIIREMQFSDYEQISKIAMQNNLNIYNYHDWKNLWLMNPKTLYIDIT